MSALEESPVMRATAGWASQAVRWLLRRGVHLLLGGIVFAPYVTLATGFVQMAADPSVPEVPLVVLIAVTVVIATVPPFLPSVRAVEITATRSLLDVDLPDPVADPPWETRLLGAAWYVLHLVCGAIAMLTVLFAAPMAVLLVAQGVGADQGWSDAVGSLPVFDNLEGGWAITAAPTLLAMAAGVFAGLAVVLSKAAPSLLGPSAIERTLALEAQVAEFAERNRLARELHDSVGHALSVTTLQAAAARRVLDTDPDFARQALEAVEDAGRAAMADLDHVLGVLRGRADETPASATSGEPTTPQRTLTDLDKLIDDTRAAGVQVETTLDGDVAPVPAAVSREAYRIVQEGLTNVLRHAGGVPVTLYIAVTSSGLDIDMSNPMPTGAAPAHDSGGRGLRGMRERVRLFRGEFDAGAKAGTWRVHAHLPTPPEDTGGAR